MPTLRRTLSKMMAKHHNFMTCPTKQPKTQPFLPSMIVFDLDDCLWTPEMFLLPERPSIPIEGDLNPKEKGEVGTIGLKVARPNGETVRLFDSAREVLREIALNPKYQGIVIGAASSSSVPDYSRACLDIEVLPELTLRQMIKYDQIGRTGELSDRKTSHFGLLRRDSGIKYEEMLFFDGKQCKTWFCDGN